MSRFWRFFIRFLLISLFMVVFLTVSLTLPLRWIDPPTSSFILQKRWQHWRDDKTQAVQQQWCNWQDMSWQIKVAVMAAEDQRFPDHYGFDLVEIQRAFNNTDQPSRGASTISQQVVKNLYLWSGRSYVRKAIEAWLTLFLELFLDKARILEIYLNIAQFSPYQFGVASIAQSAFDTTPKNLTLWQSAALASVLPNPHQYRIHKPSAYGVSKQRWIRQQIRQLGGASFLGKLEVQN